MGQDPAIAIVIDPKRTISAGKVEIGCFRAYTDLYAEKKKSDAGQFSTASTASMIPGEKVDDFGLHAHKYYKVDHNVFKSQLDGVVLDRLWNEYWIHTLSSSPLLTNKDFINKSVVSVVDKLNRINSLHMVSTSQKRGAAKGLQGN